MLDVTFLFVGVCCLLLALFSGLFVALGVCDLCLVVDGRCLFFLLLVVRCSLRVDRCLLCVACCSLFVVCCLSCFVAFLRFS